LQFGTSGIRGVFAQQIRVDTALDLTSAVIEVLGNGRYVIGNDTRRSCDLLAHIIATGLCYNGSDVNYLGVVPTPVLAYATCKGNYNAGFSVTASHNPPQFAGVKLFGSDGMGFEVGRELEIERHFNNGSKPFTSTGICTHDELVIDDYISGVMGGVRNTDKGLRILVECANGTASCITTEILKCLGHNVISLNCHKSHLFPGRGPEPIRANLLQVMEFTRNLGVDLTIVHDGDADRLVLITADGTLVPDYALSYMMLDILLADRRGDVVLSINTSNQVERLAQINGCRVTRYRLGKTYEELRRRNGVYATEPSKVIDAAWGYWEDGIYVAVALVQYLSSKGITLKQMLDDVPVTFYNQVNLDVLKCDYFEVKTKALKHFKERGISEIQEIDGLRIVLADNSWILFRSSGTERKVRIYAESSLEKESLQLIDDGKKILGVN
jgi:phosphomannomutase